jgi:diguanylate cyclase (GGDEF)-like protein
MILSRPRILIVSSRAGHARLLDVLGGLDAEITAASNARQALETAGAHEFALALLDGENTRSDIHKLAQALLAAVPGRPVLVINANGKRLTRNRHDGKSVFVDSISAAAVESALLPKLQVLLDLHNSRRAVKALQQSLEERDAQLEAEAIQRRKAEEIVHYQASHDSLTGLPNRVLCMDCLETAIQRCALEERMFALAYLDIDDFKHVNDRHGHQAGDELLRQVAVRLRTASRKSDTVARLGGDEFGIVLEEIGSADEVLPRLEKFRQEISRVYSLSFPGHRGTIEVAVSASIGAGVFPAQARSKDDLIRAADMAMYQAKATGKNRCLIWAGTTSSN